MAMEGFLKFYFWLFNKSYYDAIIRENGVKVGHIIQQEPNDIKGGGFCLISKSLKKAWLKPIPEKEIETGSLLYSDGKIFTVLLDMADSCPLVEEKTIVVESGKFINKITEKTTLKNDTTAKSGNGKAVRMHKNEKCTFKEMPSFLYDLIQGHFVDLTMQTPKTKWEELKWAIIAGVIGLVVIGWMLISSGTINHI